MASAGGVDGLLLRVASQLRAAEVPVGSGELVDASRALLATSWDDEATVRETLAATLAKSADHRERFLRLWDEVLRLEVLAAAVRSGASAEEGRELVPGDGDVSRGDVQPGDDAQGDGGEGLGGQGGQGAGAGTTLDVDELGRMVQDALGGGAAGSARGLLRDLARLAVDLARREASGVVGVDVQRIRRMLGIHRGGERADELSDAAVRAFTDELRRVLEDERAMRTGELPPERALTELGRDLALGAAPDERAIRTAVLGLRRELASAGRTRRGAASRSLDLRRTIRTSLQTGGVPIAVERRRERRRRPQLVALCDVSTSVSGSAVFFLSVVTAMQDVFAKLRTWAFIEIADEVTDHCRRAGSADELGRLVTEEARVADATGYTDYGRVFTQLAVDLDEVVDRRTTVIVLGDARTNGRDPGLAPFAAIAARAGRVLWLNPEPELYWNYGDSEASSYAPWCEMHRCATAADLTGLARLLTAR